MSESHREEGREINQCNISLRQKQKGDVEGYTPFHIDVFPRAQRVEAGQDSIAGHLDILHWKKKSTILIHSSSQDTFYCQHSNRLTDKKVKIIRIQKQEKCYHEGAGPEMFL